MDGSQHEDQPSGRGGGGLGCLVDVVLVKSLGNAVGVLADADALGGAAEDPALLAAVREQ
ncbi:hypothetical protein ACWDLG_24560 [Nonomuraea sp. NPDC003727]